MATSEQSPRAKKEKRLQKYRRAWENNYQWLECVRENVYKANCTVCHRVFSISHGGICDIKQHASGENHRRSERLRRTRGDGAFSKYLVRQASPEADMEVGNPTGGFEEASLTSNSEAANSYSEVTVTLFSEEPHTSQSQAAHTSQSQETHEGDPPQVSLSVSSKRRRSDRGDSHLTAFEREVVSAIRQCTPAAEDRDEMFLRSLLPQLQSLTPRRKEVVKFKIHQIIFEAQCSQYQEEAQLTSQ
ncbi:uncharacterized protein LOC118771200 [Megalops cyprinoides]|uniref:uncharacterized protein LOC118771200 n=1 Tax=Megalops cyprinoides TaxID=118141 RepID=UPI001863A2C9|nr:uncharacterized protein LOC118771200 [Megalops cyprinoides]